MPSQQLLDQLKQAFAESSSFMAMSPEEQAEIRAKYESATDEEVQAALKIMEQEKIFSQELDAKEAQIEADKAQAVSELKQSMKTAERLTLKDDEAVEQVSSNRAADALLKKIGADKEPKKRKKIFGIF